MSRFFAALMSAAFALVSSASANLITMAGGFLTVSYTSIAGEDSGLSHYTEFGRVADVPIPGAIWLMGVGLAVLGFGGCKKKSA